MNNLRLEDIIEYIEAQTFGKTQIVSNNLITLNSSYVVLAYSRLVYTPLTNTVNIELQCYGANQLNSGSRYVIGNIPYKYAPAYNKACDITIATNYAGLATAQINAATDEDYPGSIIMRCHDDISKGIYIYASAQYYLAATRIDGGGVRLRGFNVPWRCRRKEAAA